MKPNGKWADLIPHGSEQISDGVPFIRPEPPQVWRAHGEMLLQTVCRRVVVHLLLWVPVCRGAEMCILQLVRTTVLPAVSSRATIGLSARSFSMRSLTSFQNKQTQKSLQGVVQIVERSFCENFMNSQYFTCFRQSFEQPQIGGADLIASLINSFWISMYLKTFSMSKSPSVSHYETVIVEIFTLVLVVLRLAISLSE